MATLDYDDTDLPEYFRAKLHWGAGLPQREAREAPLDQGSYGSTDPIPQNATETPSRASERYRKP